MKVAALVRQIGAWFVTMLMLAVSLSPVSAGEQLRIRTNSDAPDEKMAADQLKRLAGEYDLQRWTFTSDVLIMKQVIPHSHPVLTLNTAYLRDDEAQLGTFVHEQFHWYLIPKRERVTQAIEAFKKIYPQAPSGGPGGAHDLQSTYLHLIVCDLELQAMTQLVGEQKAREVLAGWRHYAWIYKQVLSDPRVRQVNEQFGFVVTPSDRDAPGKAAGR